MQPSYPTGGPSHLAGRAAGPQGERGLGPPHSVVSMDVEQEVVDVEGAVVLAQRLVRLVEGRLVEMVRDGDMGMVGKRQLLSERALSHVVCEELAGGDALRDRD